MNRSTKLLKRFKGKPKDFTFDEAKRLLEDLGFERFNKGKTSGSRVQFRYNTVKIDLHKPHPSNYLKRYQLDEIEEKIKKAGKLYDQDK